MWSHPGKDSEELKIVYFPFLERWHNCFCFWQIMVLYFSTLLRKCKYTSKNYFVLAVHVFMVCLHVTINHMYNVSKNQLCAFFGPAIEIPCCNYLSLLLSYTVGLLLAVLCSYCTKIVTFLFFFFFNRLLLVTWTRSLMSTIIQWKRCAINFALVKGLLPNFFNFFWSSKQNLYKPKERTNSGKQTLAFAASVLWNNIPVDLKSLNVFNFSKKLKQYLLSEQHFETLS